MMSWAPLSLKNLINGLRDVPEWERLGIQLDISYYKLQAIAKDHHWITEDCKQAMLHHWLEADTKASWEKLLLALRNMQLNRVAEEIKKKYQISSTTTSEDAAQLVPNVITQSAAPTDPPEQTLITQSGSIPTTGPSPTPLTDPSEQSRARKAGGGGVKKGTISVCICMCSSMYVCL